MALTHLLFQSLGVVYKGKLFTLSKSPYAVSLDIFSLLSVGNGLLIQCESKFNGLDISTFPLLFMKYSFQEISRSTYMTEIEAVHDIVSISIPENVTGDVAGNKNFPSNVLEVRHCKYFPPVCYYAG